MAISPGPPRPAATLSAGVAMAAAAALLQQVALIRLFALAHWHHFAFMAVGLGLLGFGASGTALATVPALRRQAVHTAAWGAAAVVPATALALLAVYAVPFDAYLMALEPIQALYLAAQVMALVLPFFCGGLAVGAALAAAPEAAGRVYAASFLGGAAGALAALALPVALGGPGAVLGAAALAAGAAGLLWHAAGRGALRFRVAAAGALALAAAAGALGIPEVPLSPYKTLSLLGRLPDAQVVFTGRNAVSRVDVIESRAVRSAPGLSLTFPDVPPALPALTVDGEGGRGLPAPVATGFTAYLPTAVAYRLRPGHALVVGAGVEVLGALEHQMRSIAVLEANPLVADAVRRAGGPLFRSVGAPDAPAERRVDLIVEHPRTFVRRSTREFDVIQIAPAESFQVVASGAFSLAEHYLYTTQAFRDYLRRLAPGGILVVTRWLQTPPSEEVRVWAAAAAAVPDPASALIALRSLNTITVLVAPGGFSPRDVDVVRSFAAARRFDITYAPGLGTEEANRYHVLPEDLHREAFVAVLDPARRDAFLDGYPFDVRPVTDDRPFFFHFFRWRQVPQVLATLGRTWQPFGGGGYLVLVALLAIVVALSAALILAPLRVLRPASTSAQGAAGPRGRVFAYFLSLGVAYLFVEIPLLQQAILILGSPVYAAAAVLAGLLVASGIGSALAHRAERRLPVVVAGLTAGIAGLAWMLPRLIDAALGLSSAGRIGALVGILLPAGILMGMPFAAGIRMLGRVALPLVPWAWGINGCASVLASVGAAMLALEWGFRLVVGLGAIAYAAAGMAILGGWGLPEPDGLRRDGGREPPGRRTRPAGPRGTVVAA